MKEAYTTPEMEVVEFESSCSQASIYVFSANFVAYCVKNSCHTKVCLQIFALSAKNLLENPHIFPMNTSSECEDIITTSGTTSATESGTETSTLSTETSTLTTTSSTTSVTNIADEDLCSWAINDYQKKAGIVPANAEITARSKEACEITLTDENGNVLDVYTVDPKTGTGTDSSNAEVNLPQTGNNSMTNWLLCVGAAMFMALGFGAVKASGILKRKEDE